MPVDYENACILLQVDWQVETPTIMNHGHSNEGTAQELTVMEVSVTVSCAQRTAFPVQERALELGGTNKVGEASGPGTTLGDDGGH